MATNPNLNMPSYDDWVKQGPYQSNLDTGIHSRQTGEPGHTGVNTPFDPSDKNLPSYYQGYKTAVQEAFAENEPGLAKAIIRSHGQTWTDPTQTVDTTVTDTVDTTT